MSYSPSKQAKVIAHLKADLKFLETFAPIAAKRASSGDTTPDGFGSGGDGMSRSSEVSDPTASAALGGALTDEVADLWAAASKDLSAMLTAAASAQRHISRLLDVGESQRGRQSSVSACLVCLGPAVPARRGMCDADRKAWERAGKPELIPWKDRDADGAVRIRLKWEGMDEGRLAS